MPARVIKSVVQRALRSVGYELRPIQSLYIDAARTIQGASEAGLSVGAYVERLWRIEGDTEATLEELAKIGVFQSGARIVEIGAGTGRYLDWVMRHYRPSKYEVYELDADWAAWLKKTYRVFVHEADGVSLKDTPERSVDLVQAYGVFVYLPVMTSLRYFREIWRVTKEGSYVVFDVLSEECFSGDEIDRWLASDHNFPCLLPRDFVRHLFAANGFQFLAEFNKRCSVASSAVLVFRRE